MNVKFKKQMIHNYNDYLKSHNKDIVVVIVIHLLLMCWHSSSSSSRFKNHCILVTHIIEELKPYLNCWGREFVTRYMTSISVPEQFSQV